MRAYSLRLPAKIRAWKAGSGSFSTEVYRQLKALRERRKSMTDSEIDRAFDDIIQSFLLAYHAMSGSE